MNRKFLFKGWPGCTNNGCVVHWKAEGVHSDGSCKCIIDASRAKLNILQSRLSVMFSQLEDKQKPLGADFEKVLNDNKWDLYGS